MLFLGRLLVLPANVRLEWKVIARYIHSSLFGLTISNKEIFYNIDDTRPQIFGAMRKDRIFPVRAGTFHSRRVSTDAETKKTDRRLFPEPMISK
jgi:hypothetical protein